MKNFWGALGVVLTIAGSCAAIAGILYLVYLWWFGVVSGLMHFGVPAVFAVIIGIVCFLLFRGLASIVFAIFGFWSAVWLLDWNWFLALCLYMTTFAVLFVGSIIAMVSLGLAMLVSFVSDR